MIFLRFCQYLIFSHDSDLTSTNVCLSVCQSVSYQYVEIAYISFHASHPCHSSMPVIHASHSCQSSVPVIHASQSPKSEMTPLLFHATVFQLLFQISLHPPHHAFKSQFEHGSLENTQNSFLKNEHKGNFLDS